MRLNRRPSPPVGLEKTLSLRIVMGPAQQAEPSLKTMLLAQTTAHWPTHAFPSQESAAR